MLIPAILLCKGLKSCEIVWKSRKRCMKVDLDSLLLSENCFLHL